MVRWWAGAGVGRRVGARLVCRGRRRETGEGREQGGGMADVPVASDVRMAGLAPIHCILHIAY